MAGKYVRTVQESIAFSGLSVGFFTRLKVEAVLRVLGELSRTPIQRLRLLDVGCGVGMLDGPLSQAVGRVLGLDASAVSLVHAAHGAPRARYVAGQAARLPFRDAAFDAVLLVNVLHHVAPASRVECLTQAARVVTPEGLLLVLEHNRWHPLTRAAVTRCAFDQGATLIGPRTLSRMMAAAGVIPVRTAYLGFFPSEARPLRKIERLLRSVPVGTQYLVAGARPR
jgi:ubiquinone/menaquinone biosynthesis C-methylase UbiE